MSIRQPGTLELTAVTASYRGRGTVLHGIDLALKAGEFAGLLGPNGSGKSTLIKVLARINRRDGGAIRFHGDDIAALSSRDYARVVAYVPQSAPQPAMLSVRESVLLGRTPHYGIRPSAADWAAVDEAIEGLGLTDLARRTVADLSGGQAQRVLIARAIAQDPQILLLDEPTSALDLRYQVETLRLVRRVTEQRGLVSLIAIHDLNLASRFCTKIVLLQDGHIRGVGTPHEIYDEETLGSVYGLPVLVKAHAEFIEVQPAV
ncbi:ABC transporter ATP-binding protein [Microbacterium sp. BWT-B31]|uniref:ABC transporter ATP-binding protein n=1 Tax=Microbacterium sp. BWT-B31 TaxID=3232072 RepID=UPI003528FEB1